MTPAELDDLETKARAATPGPWHVNPYYPKGAVQTPDGPINQSRYVESGRGCICTTSNKGDDVDHIAAANPATVLRLVARVRELEAALLKANAGLEEYERRYYLEQDKREEAEGRVRELSATIAPFADVAIERRLAGRADDDALCCGVEDGFQVTTGVTMGDCRRAAGVLNKGDGPCGS